MFLKKNAFFYCLTSPGHPSFIPVWLLLSSWRQYLAIYFWISYPDLDTKLSRHNQNVVELKHKSRFRYGVKYLFFLHRNLSLPLILVITFKAIASPDKLSSNSQPKMLLLSINWFWRRHVCPEFQFSFFYFW